MRWFLRGLPLVFNRAGGVHQRLSRGWPEMNTALSRSHVLVSAGDGAGKATNGIKPAVLLFRLGELALQ